MNPNEKFANFIGKFVKADLEILKNFAMTVMIDKFSSTHRKEWSLCPYYRQKKIEKEEAEKKRIIKYKYPGNDHIP